MHRVRSGGVLCVGLACFAFACSDTETTTGTSTTTGSGGSGGLGGGNTGGSAGDPGAGGVGGAAIPDHLSADLDGVPTEFFFGLFAEYDSNTDFTQVAGIHPANGGSVVTSLAVGFPGNAAGTFDCASNATGNGIIRYEGPDSNGTVRPFESWFPGNTCTITVTEHGARVVGTFVTDVKAQNDDTHSFENGLFDVALE